MADSSKSGTASTTEKEKGSDGVGDLVGQIFRNAAGEAVKGGSSIAETTKRIVADAVDTLDERGPDITKNAGIFTWRYAMLGWATCAGWRVERAPLGGSTGCHLAVRLGATWPSQQMPLGRARPSLTD